MTVVVVAGVAGSGKTEVGRALARRMSVDFVDADSFHSPEAVQQMRANHPLTEREREAWLSRLVRAVRGRDPLVIACSALRRSHRDRLRTLGDVRLFMLDVPDNELRRRLDVRRGHVQLLEVSRRQRGTSQWTNAAKSNARRFGGAWFQAWETA